MKLGNFLTIEKEGGVATVTMDRGDGRNALSREQVDCNVEQAGAAVFRRIPGTAGSRACFLANGHGFDINLLIN